MGWLFVPGLEDSSSVSVSPSDPPIGVSVMLRGKHSSPESWRRACKTAPWIPLLSGTMFRPSMADHGVDAWISSLPVSHASHTAKQGNAKGQKTSDGSGHQSPGSSKKWDPRRCFLKMYGGYSRARTGKRSRRSLATWPAWGSWDHGGPSERPMPARFISETESSSSQLGLFGGNDETVDSRRLMLPTPCASQGGSNRGGGSGRVGPYRPSLNMMASTGMWPTPTASQRGDCPSERERRSPTLCSTVNMVDASRMYPTPTVGDAKASGASGYSTDSGRHSGITLTDAICGEAASGRSGKLNPSWVEWLMGWPIGWTDYEPMPSHASLEHCPWNGDPWSVWNDEVVARTSEGTRHRADRLRAIGNGVVPQQAALAFLTLMDEVSSVHRQSKHV